MTGTIIAAILGLATAIAAYWQGGRNARRDEREKTLKKSKDIGDAINDADNASWRDRLRKRRK